jgi:hypothetical protein
MDADPAERLRMTKLWALVIWLLDPDRIYKVFWFGSLIVALLLLVAALSGSSTIHWRKWEVY